MVNHWTDDTKGFLINPSRKKLTHYYTELPPLRETVMR